VVPQHPEAEQVAVALTLQGDAVCDRVLSSLSTDHLYSHTLGVVLEAARGIRARQESVDMVNLLAELDQRGLLEKVGKATVLGLGSEYVTSAQAPRYIEIVIDMWMRRTIHTKASQIAVEALNGGTGSELASRLRDEASAVLGSVSADTDTSRFAAVAERLTAEIESDVDDSKVMATPFPHKLMAMRPGRLYVLGGYAGEGKTIFAIQQTRVASAAGAKVAFFTLEMSDKDLIRRAVRAWGVPIHRQEAGRLPDALRSSYDTAVRDISGWPGWLFDTARTAEAICRTCFAVKPDLVVIDHLHNLQLDPSRETRPQLEHALYQFVEVSLALEVPVLLLAQFHRPPGSDGYPRPTMHSYRDTGKIEQLASALWAIYRKRDDGQRTSEGSFLILKNRFGSDGMFPVEFDEKTLQFVVPSTEPA
jgi:replicative DNA helicase